MDLADLSPLQILILVLVLCVTLIGIVGVVLLAFAPPGTLQTALPVFLFLPPTVAALLSIAKLGSVQKRAVRDHEAIRTEIKVKNARLTDAEERLAALERVVRGVR